MFLSIESYLTKFQYKNQQLHLLSPVPVYYGFSPKNYFILKYVLFQVQWQETLRGYVAGVLTTHRVLIVSADLDILACSSTKFDKGLPSISLDAFLLLFQLFYCLFTIFLVGYSIFAWILNFLDTIDLFYGLGLHFFFQLPLLLVCLDGMAK